MPRYIVAATLPYNTPPDQVCEYISPPCPGCHVRTLFELPRSGYTAWITGTPIGECFPGFSRDTLEQMLTGWHLYCWWQRPTGDESGYEPHRHDYQGGSDA